MRNSYLLNENLVLQSVSKSPDLNDYNLLCICDKISEYLSSFTVYNNDTSFNLIAIEILQKIRTLSPATKYLFFDELSNSCDGGQMYSEVRGRDFKRLIEEHGVVHSLQTIHNTSNGMHVKSMLDSISKKLHRSGGMFRSSNISIRPQSGGRRIIFPRYEEVSDSMLIIDREVNTIYKTNQVLAAIYAFLAVLHVHPFVDGNGAAARILLNLILNGDNNVGMKFVPIQLLESIDRTSFNIMERRASYEGQYVPLMSYILNFLKII